MLGDCKLCGKENELCRRSHIIPEFMYQYLFDEQKRYQRFRGINKPVGKIQRKGEYEGEILCQTCEREVLGKFESYAAKALYSKNLDHFPSPNIERCKTGKGVNYHKVSNLDYPKFKLFLIILSLESQRFLKGIFFQN